MSEELLPKPKTDLPKPEKDLPLPEKEITTNSTPVHKSGSKIKWLVLGIISALIIFGIGAGVIYFLNEKKNIDSSPLKPISTSPTPSENEVICTQEAKLCPDGVTYVGRSGPNCEFEKCPTDSANTKTYINNKAGWQIDYPTNENIKISTFGPTQIGQNGIGDVTTFTKVGPTQSEGTEFYDGYSMTIGLKSKSENQSVKDFADSDSKPDPEISTRSDLKNIFINGHKGIETTVSGLGEARLVYLEYPGSKDKVYYISIFSTGPGESEEKYDAIVEEMLNSFKSVPTSE